jgi:2-methylcitrate dehydratase
VLELKAKHRFKPEEISSVEVLIFEVAHRIIGGGEEGEKTNVRTKEQADHSLPYLIAVALLDGQVTPAQYEPERIVREDVQSLLRKVLIRPSPEFSTSFPNEMPCRIMITLHDGSVLVKDKRDYEGFYTRPIQWDSAVRKFRALADGYATNLAQDAIVQAIADLENIPIARLTLLLAQLAE